MVILGRTDHQTLKTKKTFKRKISIFKGTRRVTLPYKSKEGRYPSAGLDLKNFYRLEVRDEYIRKILIKEYSSPEEQAKLQQKVKEILAEKKAQIIDDSHPEYSIYFVELPVLLAYKDINKSFDNYYGLQFKKSEPLSGLKHKCNRREIYYQVKPRVDKNGDMRSDHLDNCSDPCPVAETTDDCSLGCSLVGELHFYLPKLLDLNILDVAVLTFTGETDTDEVSEYLYGVTCELGSATTAIGCYFSHHRVLYKLKRREVAFKRPLFERGKRTGKKTDDVTGAIQLQVDPVWKQQWLEIQQIEQIKQLGGRPTPRALAAAYAIDCLDVEFSEVPNLNLPSSEVYQTHQVIPAVSAWHCDREKRAELKELAIAHQWQSDQLIALYSRYGLSNNDFESFYASLTQTGFEQIKMALQSSVAKEVL